MTRGTDSQSVQVTVTNRSSASDPVLTVTPAIKAADLPGSYTDDDELHIYIIARQKGHDPDVSNLTSKINVYSFALKPEEHQPSGTCNFSRIDNARLNVTGNDANLYLFAMNYNVLRIMSGMGGLAYSN